MQKPQEAGELPLREWPNRTSINFSGGLQDLQQESRDQQPSLAGALAGNLGRQEVRASSPVPFSMRTSSWPHHCHKCNGDKAFAFLSSRVRKKKEVERDRKTGKDWSREKTEREREREAAETESLSPNLALAHLSHPDLSLCSCGSLNFCTSCSPAPAVALKFLCKLII